jgi:hypothetical protein
MLPLPSHSNLLGLLRRQVFLLKSQKALFYQVVLRHSLATSMLCWRISIKIPTYSVPGAGIGVKLELLICHVDTLPKSSAVHITTADHGANDLS